MGIGGGGSTPYIPVPGATYQATSNTGIPTSVVLNEESLNNSLRKEIVYKELDRVFVPVTDTNPLSPNYLRVTYLPEEFKLGKNLIRIRPNVELFEENTQLYIEIIDYNGDPIYYETELNSETSDTFIIISVYIYEDTPPGPCAIYILGTLKNVAIPPANQIYPVNFRWAQILNVDTSEKTTSPIIFTTLPDVQVVSNTASYDILVYPGGAPFTSSTFYNVQLNNGLLNPSITPLNTYDKFISSMYTGELRVEYDHIRLISPQKFDTEYLLGGGVTASIKDFITNKSLTLEEPIVIYQQNKSEQIILDTAIFTTASINFEQSASITLQSNFKKRILVVTFNDLDPFVGQIRSIKTLYRDTALSNTEYLLLSDFIVPSENVYEGFNPISSSFSLLLPDSEIDQHFDLRFEFYNNEIVPSKQVLEIKDILVEGTPKVTVAGSGILMVDTVNATLDAKNMVRTLYQNYDTYILHTSSYKLESDISVPQICKCCEPKLITQFTGFIEDGAPYVTAYYNAAISNITQQTNTDEIGVYSYNTILEVYEMSTSSFANFTYDIDEIRYPKLISSTASIQLSSDYPSGHTAYGYPIKHIIKLPTTNKLYRFALWHNITIPSSASYGNLGFADFNTPASWSYALLPGITSISNGTASIQLNPGQSGYLIQTLQSPLSPASNYKVSFDVTTYNAPLAGDYISVGLNEAGLSDPSLSSVSSSGQIINIGTYQYLLSPNASEPDKFYIYFTTGPSAGSPNLNSYQIAATYSDGFSTNVNVTSPTLLTDAAPNGGLVPFTTISSTDPRISLNPANNRNFTANVPDTYTFFYDINISASLYDLPAIGTGGIYPRFKVYDSSNTLLTTVPLNPAVLYSSSSMEMINPNKNYTGNLTFVMSTGDYVRFELYYIANNAAPTTSATVLADGTFTLIDPTIVGGSSTYEIRNIRLALLSSTSASFETSCSIKDINVLSSGLLFVSGSQSTYVSGAYDYYVPVV